MAWRRGQLAGLSLVWVLAFGVGLFGVAQIALASGGVTCHRWVIRNNENLTFHHVNCNGLWCPMPCDCWTGVHYHNGKEQYYCFCFPPGDCPGTSWDCEPTSNPVTNKIACKDLACSPKACVPTWKPYDWVELGHPEPPPEWGANPDYLTCPCK